MREEFEKLNTHERYELLDRMKQDCEYFLNRSGDVSLLWGGGVTEHIRDMRELLQSLPEEPEWLSARDVKAYEQKMHRMYGVNIIRMEDETYPKRLLRYHEQKGDAPKKLFVRGDLPAEDGLYVAILGARICSEYGRYIARLFGADLAREGISLIGGLAMGVDGIAMRAALGAGGKAYGVMGCGVNVCYPPEHKELHSDVIRNAGILSEYADDTKPEPAQFVQRNRIIASLADAAIVVEARAKSATRITVDLMRELGKKIYVVPGRLTDRLSDGTNELIRQGESLVPDAREIARQLRERAA